MLTPPCLSYVILSGTLTTLVNVWQGIVVTGARRAAGVPYPNAYASKEQVDATEAGPARDSLIRFNSAQRAHANFLENHTNNLMMILVAGLRYPVAASALGVFWSLNRILFAKGYMDVSKKDGGGRYRGVGHFFGWLGLLGLTVKTAVDLLTM